MARLRGQANLRVAMVPERTHQARFFALLSHFYHVCLVAELGLRLDHSHGSKLLRPQQPAQPTKHDFSFFYYRHVRGRIFSI